MRRLILLLTLSLLVTSFSCKRARRARVETVEEEQGALASSVNTADPRHAVQLLRGFYELEQNAWRWTQGKFSVTLKTPSKTGATLTLKFSLPGAVIERIHSTDLSAKIGDLVLEPEKYDKPGDYLYTRDLPASALSSDSVTIDFAWSKFLAAGEVEGRELASIVNSVGLKAK